MLVALNIRIYSHTVMWLSSICSAHNVNRHRSKVWYHRSALLSSTHYYHCLCFVYMEEVFPLARAGEYLLSLYITISMLHITVQYETNTSQSSTLQYNLYYKYVEWRHRHFSCYSVSWSCKFVLLMDQK